MPDHGDFPIDIFMYGSASAEDERGLERGHLPPSVKVTPESAFARTIIEGQLHQPAITVQKPSAPVEITLVPVSHDPGPGEVLIRIAMMSVSVGDVIQYRSGLSLPRFADYQDDVRVLGTNWCGGVLKVGPPSTERSIPASENDREHSRLQAGDQVFGFTWASLPERCFQLTITTSTLNVSKLQKMEMPRQLIKLTSSDMISAWYGLSAKVGLSLCWPPPPESAVAEGKSLCDMAVLVWGAHVQVGRYMVRILQRWGFSNIIAVARPDAYGELRAYGARACFDCYSDESVEEITKCIRSIRTSKTGSRLPFLVDCLGGQQSSQSKLARIAPPYSRVGVVLPHTLQGNENRHPLAGEKPANGEFNVSNFARPWWQVGVFRAPIRATGYATNSFLRRKLQTEIVPWLMEMHAQPATDLYTIKGGVALQRVQRALRYVHDMAIVGEWVTVVIHGFNSTCKDYCPQEEMMQISPPVRIGLKKIPTFADGFQFSLRAIQLPPPVSHWEWKQEVGKHAKLPVEASAPDQPIREIVELTGEEKDEKRERRQRDHDDDDGHDGHKDKRHKAAGDDGVQQHQQQLVEHHDVQQQQQQQQPVGHHGIQQHQHQHQQPVGHHGVQQPQRQQPTGHHGVPQQQYQHQQQDDEVDLFPAEQDRANFPLTQEEYLLPECPAVQQQPHQDGSFQKFQQALSLQFGDLKPYLNYPSVLQRYPVTHQDGFIMPPPAKAPTAAPAQAQSQTKPAAAASTQQPAESRLSYLQQLQLKNQRERSAEYLRYLGFQPIKVENNSYIMYGPEHRGQPQSQSHEQKEQAKPQHQAQQQQQGEGGGEHNSTQGSSDNGSAGK